MRKADGVAVKAEMCPPQKYLRVTGCQLLSQVPFSFVGIYEIYPEQYGLNNKLESNLIPIHHAGRDFGSGQSLRLRRAIKENMVTGGWYHYLGSVVEWEYGWQYCMFYQDHIDISDYIHLDRSKYTGCKSVSCRCAGTVKPRGGKRVTLNDEFQNGGTESGKSSATDDCGTSPSSMESETAIPVSEDILYILREV